MAPPHPNVEPSSPGVWRLGVCVALVAHALAWGLLVSPGALLLDEGTNQLAARAMATGGGFDLGNGYAERPAAALTMLAPGFSAQVTPQLGRLVSQYPPGFAALSAPLTAAFGVLGVNLVSGVAVVFAAGLTAALAPTGQRLIPLGILLFGTFFWEYGLAATPHASALAFGLGALVTAARRPALAGLLFGLGVTQRLDGVLFLPALAAAMVVAGPGWARRWSFGILGASPPLLALAWSNQTRFGAWSLLSYGVSETSPASHVARTAGVSAHLGSVGLGLAFLSLWGAARGASGRGRGALVAVGLGLLGLIGVEPTLRLLRGVYALVVDLRVLEIPALEPAMARGPGGGVIYLACYKRALLQSCPWLVLLLGPLVSLLRQGPLVLLRSPLWLVIFVWVGLYGALGWHGGLGLNQRYLLPVLPAAAILVSPLVKEITAGRAAAVAFGFAVTAPGVLAATRLTQPPSALAEQVFYGLPLVLAAVLGLLTWARSGAAALALGLSLGWSAGQAVVLDLNRHRHQRQVNQNIAEAVGRVVPDHALVLAEVPDPLFGLHDRPGVILASRSPDGGASAPGLIRHHLDRGRPCFALFTERKWRAVGAQLGEAGVRGEAAAELGELRVYALTTATGP
ncbi:hypothetical protein L6R46_14415 [Myxococcota bacterium]|nr:hypothetical protein [Myxococcota bacterium]